MAFCLQTSLMWCIVRGMKDPHDDLIFPALSEEMDDTKRPGVLRRFWNATLKILGKIGYYLLCTIGIILSVVVSLSFWIAPIVGVVWLVIYFAFPETRGRDDTEEELPIEERQAQALGAVLQNMQPLDALSAVADVSADAVAGAYDGAEASLFDDGSATVRLAAFVFLCRLAASSPERSDLVWPLLDEAIQCYHGDAEYRDMLVVLLELARGNASDKTKKALAARVSFDAENSSGYLKALSNEILQALA